MKILALADETGILSMLRETLDVESFEFEVAQDCKILFQKLDDLKPDLIVLVNGPLDYDQSSLLYKLLYKLSRDEKHGKTLVLVLSESNKPLSWPFSFEAGACLDKLGNYVKGVFTDKRY